MEFPVALTHVVAVVRGIHARISLKTPLFLSRFGICMAGAV